MGNLLIDGNVGVIKTYFDDGNHLSTKDNGWNEYHSGSKSLDITIQLDLRSNGDVSFLLGDNGRPCSIKINNYIIEQLKNGI